MTEFNIKEFFAKNSVLDHGFIELIDGMVTDPRLKVVNAARVSFNKESKEFTEKDEKLVKFLYEHGHFSTYRHSFFSFRIKAPLLVFRQWWKYQVGSEWMNDEIGSQIQIPETNWNEASGRYVEFDELFYTPETFRKQSKNNKQGSEGEVDDPIAALTLYQTACENQFSAYRALIQLGTAKEIARGILPQNIYSECIWTVSLQGLVHFFNQRLKPDAQFEIREYAKATYLLCKPFMECLIKQENI